MLRLLLKQKNPAALTSRTLFKSLAGAQKASISSQSLEDGEYIEGDFDLEGGNTGAQAESKREDFRKKYVSFENFEHNLIRQTPKPTANYKNSIGKSVKSLQDKFKFELAQDDEFAREIKKREAPAQVIVEDAEPHASQANLQNEVQDALKRIKGGKTFEQLEQQNLQEYQFEAKTIDMQQRHPLKIYRAQQLKELEDAQDQSMQAFQEYQRGEEGVDFIHPGDDFTKVFDNMHSEIVDQVYGLRDTLPRGQVNKRKLDEWRIRVELQRNDLTSEFELQQYPGSAKGPHPDDDPEYFADWLYRTMPEQNKEAYSKMLETERQKQREEIGEDHPDFHEFSTNTLVGNAIPNTEIVLTHPIAAMLEQRNTSNAFHSFIPKEEGEINPFPDQMEMDYQSAQTYIEKWAIFRLYPRINYLSENLHQAIADAMAGRHNQADVKIPSLYRYYSLLPEFARNNPIIINLVRAFEFSKHEMTLEQKEIALNYAAQFCLPMEAALEDAVKEAVISQKYIIPMWEEQQLLMEDADSEKSEAYVPGQKKKKGVQMLQIGDEILNADRSELKPADADQMAQWNKPPRLDPNVPEEDPFPILPLDYYQNEDGFWNNYISWKEARYDELPMMMTRRSFKH
jgi:hypothetical protein